jgi:hypothetical protein
MDLQKFYQATNPTETIKVSNPEEKPYYINFSPVRGGPLIEQICNRITNFSPDDPTCTLFTGHIGSGKSTELSCLQDQLQQKGFHVVYCISTDDLEMNDVDVSDILLAIAFNITRSLKEITIPEPKNFMSILQGAGKVLNTEIDITNVKFGVPKNPVFPDGVKVEADNTGKFSLAFGIGEITAKTKNDSVLRHRLNEYLGSKKNELIKAINEELLLPTIAQLKAQDKKGLVVIVDNLDRLDNHPKPFGRPQHEYIFIDQGDYLNKLECHLIYTIPITLRFVQDYNTLTERFKDPKVLPMVATRTRDGEICEEGMALLRQMVLARAFPTLSNTERLEKITEVFDEPATLDRLCEISGGHVRGILKILNRWIEEEMQLPLTRQRLERIIISQRDEKKLSINSDEEWELLKKVYQEKDLKESIKYQSLIKNLFIFQYCNSNHETWFDLNPVLIGLEELK